MSSVELTDLLTGIFEVSTERAQQAAKNLSLENFSSNFSRLESLIGFDNAAKVVKEGEFLDYKNGDFNEYFRLATQVASAIKDSSVIPVPVFYSIQSLQHFMSSGEAEAKVKIDSSKLDIARYKILHKSNEQSSAYLDSIIEKGEVIVQGHEHWNKGQKDKGTRGMDIIKKLAYELNILFNDLGLGKPEFDLNYGQMKLTVGPTTREYLKEIRRAAYELQSK